MRTSMRSLTQRLLDGFPAARTVGTGVVRWDSNRYHPKHLAEIFQPLEVLFIGAWTNRGAFRSKAQQFIGATSTSGTGAFGCLS